MCFFSCSVPAVFGGWNSHMMGSFLVRPGGAAGRNYLHKNGLLCCTVRTQQGKRRKAMGDCVERSPAGLDCPVTGRPTSCWAKANGPNYNAPPSFPAEERKRKRSARRPIQGPCSPASSFTMPIKSCSATRHLVAPIVTGSTTGMHDYEAVSLRNE
jgi:hypothetical protein